MQEIGKRESFRDKILAMLPEERKLDLMKVINDAGLRSDDEAFALLYIMGYIKTLYEDMPDAVEQMNHVVWQMSDSLESSMQAILNKNLDSIKMDIHAHSSRAAGNLQNMSQRFAQLLQAHEEKIQSYASLLDAENEKLREKSRHLFISAMRLSLIHI